MAEQINTSIGPDSILIDKIVYLAGLVSQQQIIDPLLDTLRVVTASTGHSKPLSDKHRRQLYQLEEQIKDHLIHRDPLRSFTREQLENRLETYVQHSNPNHKILQQVYLIIASSALAFVIAGTVSWFFWRPQAFVIGLLPSMIALYWGIGWLFISGLKTFTRELRRAYAWICMGMMGLGIGAVLWVPYSLIPSVYKIPLFRYGGAILLIAASFFVTYIGIRQFANIVRVRTVSTSWPTVIVAVAAASMIASVLPHGNVPDASYLDGLLVAFSVITTLGIIISLTAYQIKKKLAISYANAMGWFGAAYTWAACVAIIAIGVLVYTGLEPGIRLALIGGSCGVASIMLLIAGYKFKLSSGGS